MLLLKRKKAEQYGVSGYPTLKYFSKDDKNGKDYDGGRDLPAFITYLNTHAGTERTPEGGYLPHAGTISDFSDLVEKFKSATSAVQKTVLQELEGKLKSLKNPLGKFYQITMKNVIEKGKEYVEKESARLQRLIDSGSVAKDKFGEFAKRLNIVNLFK